MNITFKRVGRTDYMGYTWYYVYVDGQPFIKNGVHVAYHSLDKKHAFDMHIQMNGKEVKS
jgi:hypothetical protein